MKIVKKMGIRVVDIVCHGAAIRDAVAVHARPGAVAIERGRIVAAGHPEDLSRIRARQVIDLPQHMLLPALVNAHAHLVLTCAGPRPYPGSFTAWLKLAMSVAPQDDQAIASSVRLGLEQSHRAGVGQLGDISGGHIGEEEIRSRLTPIDTPQIPGVSYLECFGHDHDARRSIDQLKQRLDSLQFPGPSKRLVIGITPHAPYSAGTKLYIAAGQLGRMRGYPLCTHLAETPEEIQFIHDANGPFADLLREIGKWDKSIRPTGLHPIDWFSPQLEKGRWLLAHCHYVQPHHLALLARCKASVAYCPLASEYFGHIDHRYREMLASGVNVCLGTDSVLCQPPANRQPLGILPQMRHLYQRDGTDALTLLKMATVNGMRGLQLDARDATFQPGSRAQVVGVRIDPDDESDPLTQALGNEYPLEPVTTEQQIGEQAS